MVRVMSEIQGKGAKEGSRGSQIANRSTNSNGVNRHKQAEKYNGSANSSGEDLDQRILGMEKVVSAAVLPQHPA